MDVRFLRHVAQILPTCLRTTELPIAATIDTASVRLSPPPGRPFCCSVKRHIEPNCHSSGDSSVESSYQAPIPPSTSSGTRTFQRRKPVTFTKIGSIYEEREIKKGSLLPKLPSRFPEGGVTSVSRSSTGPTTSSCLITRRGSSPFP